MKRLLPAILFLLLGPGAWAQPQTGVGVAVNPVPGAGTNAAAASLRIDLGGSNPAAPASMSLGLSLPASLPLSTRVSPAAVGVQAAVPATGDAAGTARAENGMRAAPSVAASRTAQAETGARAAQRAKVTPAPLRNRTTLSSSEDPSSAPAARGEGREPTVVLKRLAASPLGGWAFDGDLQRSQTDADGSLREAEAPDGSSGNFLKSPGTSGAREVRHEPPDPMAAPSGSGEQTPSRVGGPLAADPEPFKLPLWKRALAVTGILGSLAAAPSLLNAAALQTVGQAVMPSLSSGNTLSIFTQNAGLLLSPWAWGIAAALALIGPPLRIFVFRLSPWSMHWLKDPGNGLAKKPLGVLLPLLAVAAASEELVFRAMAFGLSFVFLSTLMAAPLALAAASFLSSLVFALIHGYGPVWTRVVGGMLYSAAFAVTGSLLFITLTHMLFNLWALSLARRRLGK